MSVELQRVNQAILSVQNTDQERFVEEPANKTSQTVGSYCTSYILTRGVLMLTEIEDY